MEIKLPSVPELRPTAEEFVHPIRYLSQPEIAKLGEKYGILKVIPPENWDPRFALDWDTFKFHTRIQNLHELNLRNRSRACFVEGFNCFIQSKGLDPLPTTDDLCLGVSDDFILKRYQLNSHLNGWLELKNGFKIHIHDIFISKEYRKWFYKIKESDKSLLKLLTAYSKYLLKILDMNDDVNGAEEIDGIVLPPEISNMTLHRLMMSPASLLVQPENIKQLMRMKSKSRKNNFIKKQERETKSHQQQMNAFTPPLDDSCKFSSFSHNIEETDTGIKYLPLTPEILSPELLDESCSVCHSSNSPESTLLCDGCSKAFHMKCLPLPLERVPKYDWFCGECLAGLTCIYSQYGFEEEFERKFSLNEFKKYCSDWETEFMQLLKTGKLGIDFEVLGLNFSSDKLSEESMEELFWYLTNGKISIPSESEDLKIRYGADINLSSPGEISGFPSWDNPRVKENEKEYVESEWNLTRLPFAKGSLLEYICSSEFSDPNDEKVNEQISGMSIPWIYVGGPLSTFCWHKEDHYTLSANYSHLGAPKKWYGIPSHCCEEFEKLINEIAPEYEAKQKDLMHQLVSMVSPNDMMNKSNNAEVNGKKFEMYETIQRPGEFIITFPRVYHSGFNYGFNVNEAVNFTLPLWIPYSVPAVEEYKESRKECVFDTFKLLRKIVNDLATVEGRDQWMKDTGISEDEVLKILNWGYDKYIDEIRKFFNVFNDKKFLEIYKGLKKISLGDYFFERRKIIENSEGLEALKGLKDQEIDNNIATDIGIDDKLCVDCKTRVHFQWILVDLFEDSIREAEFICEKNGGTEKEKINGLGIGIKYKYKDIESEWKDIIEIAEAEAGVDEDQNEERIQNRRSSRRISKKRERENKDEMGNFKVKLSKKNNEGFQEMRGVLESLKVLKRENGFFGRSVICLDCFQKEIKKLNIGERERVLKESRVVEEYKLEELSKFLNN